MHIHTEKSLYLNTYLLIDRSIGRVLDGYLCSGSMHVCIYIFLYITQVLREGVFKDHKQESDKINFLKPMSGVFFYVSQGYLRDLSTLSLFSKHVLCVRLVRNDNRDYFECFLLIP